MGTTFCSIHVYTAETVSSGQFRFQSYSENWHTCVLGKKESSDPEISSKFAKKISKNLEVPVLWFCELDSDYIFLNSFNRVKLFQGILQQEILQIRDFVRFRNWLVTKMVINVNCHGF